MKQNQITKEEIKKLMEIPGKTRGVVFQTDAEYVREKKGEEELRSVEKTLKEWDCPIDYGKIKATDWYPVGLRAVSLLAIKETFGWGDKEIKDMGESAPKYSFIVKMLLKYFLTLKKSWQVVAAYWKKHYTVGSLEPAEYHEKEKYLTLYLKDFKIHPILCTYLFAGYFVGFTKCVKKSKKITGEETKCMFKGDPYHEGVIRWE